MAKVTVFNKKASKIQVRAHLVRDEKGREICSARVLECQEIGDATIPSRLTLSWPNEETEVEVTLQVSAINHLDGNDKAARLFACPVAPERKN